MNDAFVGTWRLVEYLFVREDGLIKKPWGDDVKGVLIYSAEGYMSANLMPAVRPQKGSQPPESEAKMRRAPRYIAYAGTYSATAETMTHHVDVSLFPGWVGLPQVRYYELTAKRLILRTPPIPRLGQHLTGQLTWSRVL